MFSEDYFPQPSAAASLRLTGRRALNLVPHFIFRGMEGTGDAEQFVQSVRARGAGDPNSFAQEAKVVAWTAEK